MDLAKIEIKFLNQIPDKITMKAIKNRFSLALLSIITIACNERFSVQTRTPANTGSQASVPAIIGNYQFTSLFAGLNYAFGYHDGIGTNARLTGTRGMQIDGNEMYIGDGYKLRKLNLSNWQVTTLAGSGAWGDLDGQGELAEFKNTFAMQSVGSDLFFGDYQSGKIKKMDSSFNVTTVADQGYDTVSITGMAKIGTDIYYTHAHSVWKFNTLTSIATIVAGDPIWNGSADGTGTAARFFGATDIATDGTDLYVTDCQNHAIRKLTVATSEVTTLSGTLGVSGYIEAVGAAARYNCPSFIKYNNGMLYTADLSNNVVRMVNPASGESHFIAGQQGVAAFSNGVGVAAGFETFAGMTMNDDYIFIAESATIRKLDLVTHEVTTPVGIRSDQQYVDGSSGIGQLYQTNYITSDGTNLFVTDETQHTIRKISADGAISTIAGQSGVSGNIDGVGTSAQFNYPTSIYADGDDIYVTDTDNYLIRKIDIDGNVTTVAGQSGVSVMADGTGVLATFDYPHAITKMGEDFYILDGDNNMTTTLRKMTSSGVITTVAGDNNDLGWDCQPGPGLTAKLSGAYDIVGVNGNLYIPICNYIFKIDSNFDVTIFAGDGTDANQVGFSTLAKIGGPRSISTDGTYLYTMARGQLVRIRIIDGYTEFIGGLVDDYTEINGSISNRGIANCKGLVYTSSGLFCTSYYGVHKFY
jgi:hypothetical protein